MAVCGVPGQRTCLINDYPIAYVEQGCGPVLLLVHGTLADYRYWAPQLMGLSTHFRVIALSLRHYWPMPWAGLGNDFTLEQHASDVGMFIARVAKESVHLVGHSRGGGVALRTAICFPEWVRSLTLADPLAPLDTPIFAAKAAGRNSAPDHGEDPRDAAVKLIEAGQVEAGLALFIDVVSGDGVWRRLNKRRRQMPLDNAYTILAQLHDASYVFKSDDLAALHRPVLLMNGERSADIYRERVDDLCAIWPGARRVTVAAAAHAMSAENPQAFNAAVLAFILSLAESDGAG